MGTKLKPCPFCGSSNITLSDYQGLKFLDHEYEYCLECKKCKFIFFGVAWTEKQLVMNWNKRYVKLKKKKKGWTKAQAREWALDHIS